MEPFCALSTPAGVSGIAVIRASGEGVSLKASKALKILRTTGDRTEAALTDLKGYESAYARFIDPSDNRTIDDVVVTFFEGPHSYTGEDMIEISCHGGQAVRQEILRVLHELGIRPAEPGEFTKTAFINGKLDLTEAEAGVVRRARNAHQNPPKNADPAEYHRATALEALIGYLYITGQEERLLHLFDISQQEEPPCKQT